MFFPRVVTASLLFMPIHAGSLLYYSRPIKFRSSNLVHHDDILIFPDRAMQIMQHFQLALMPTGPNIVRMKKVLRQLLSALGVMEHVV